MHWWPHSFVWGWPDARRHQKPKHLSMISNAGLPLMSVAITQAARMFWQPLADNYDLAALRNIGHLYRLGQGVARDGEKAVRYYTRAAELGFAPAQLNLAVMLYEGDGIPADAKAARYWAQRAASAGYAPAIKWLVISD